MTATAVSDAGRRRPVFIPVALATLQSAAPVGAEWIHEEKLDGYRIEAIVHRGTVHLFSRNRKDWTSRFPGVVAALAALPVDSAVLDGEIVAVDANGAASFQGLQQALESHEIHGVHYYAFDLLQVGGLDVRELPFALRRELLHELLALGPRGGVVQPTRQFDPSRGDPLAQACASGIEGVVSKRDDISYPVGRSPYWVKSKCARRQEFVIVGYTDPQGSRTQFGALLLGVYDGATLRYVGKVGTGFDTEALVAIRRQLRPLTTASIDIASTVSIPRAGLHWVRPTLVAEVTFTEWTADGLLRHPVFKGMRQDKPARDVRRED